MEVVMCGFASASNAPAALGQGAALDSCSLAASARFLYANANVSQLRPNRKSTMAGRVCHGSNRATRLVWVSSKFRSKTSIMQIVRASLAAAMSNASTTEKQLTLSVSGKVYAGLRGQSNLP